jgi:hypothetical protein
MDPLGIVSAVAAVGSLIGAWAVYRGQTRQVNFDMARALHVELTTGDVVAARGDLFRFKLGELSYSQEIIRSYFILLWCFERLWEGRRALQRKAGSPSARRSAAVRFLDDAIHWHVHVWAESIPVIRSKINEALLASNEQSIDDGDSLDALFLLAEALHAAGIIVTEHPKPVGKPASSEVAAQ